MVGESASALFADAQEMLDKIITEHWLKPTGVVGLWRARRDGDDVFALAGNEEVRLPFLRQQVRKRAARANMCLADFIDGEATTGSAASRSGSTASSRTSNGSAPRPTIIPTSC